MNKIKIKQIIKQQLNKILTEVKSRQQIRKETYNLPDVANRRRIVDNPDDTEFRDIYQRTVGVQLSEACVNETVSNYPPISFPKDEYNDLRTRAKTGRPIVTIRVSKEYGKYKVGKVYRTAFGYNLKVVKELYIDDLRDYPYYNEIKNNKAWIQQLKKYGQDGYHVLWLKAV